MPIRVQFRNDEAIDSITNTQDENTAIQRQLQTSGGDSRRNSTLLGISQLEGIIEEEEDDDFSKATTLADDKVSTGKDVFGFRTPKKSGTMALKAMEEINRTPKSALTPTSRRGATPKSGSKQLLVTPNKVGTPGRRSASSTPTRGILKSSEKKRLGRPPTTPMSARKKVRKTLIQISENIELNRYSDSDNNSGSDSDKSSDEEEENTKPIIGPPSTPRTPARKGRPGRVARAVNTTNLADSYFEAQTSRVITSNRTLSRQNTPRLNEDEVNKLLDKTKPRYAKEIQELIQDHKEGFIRWMSLIHRGYSIVTFGLGSKKSLLETFQRDYLGNSDVLVVNGYFPSLTIRSILDGISDDILDIHSSHSSTNEQIQNIHEALEEDLYLIIHNIDGVMLRNSKAQSCLSQLSNHPRVKLLCSIDHINAPLIWDQFMLARFNFIWFDCTTFLPYKEEAAGSNAMMKASGGLQLASIQHVLDALTPGAKKIFILLAKYQIDHQEPHYPGIPFMELYTQCRADFLVTSDLELKAQLTEFRDHKLITSKRGSDGVEYLIIPIDKTTLSGFLESYEG